MKILITGGAGFIGSQLSKALLRGNHQILVLDDFSTGRRENLDIPTDNNFELIDGSVLDHDLLSLLIRKVDYVFHLAAAVGVFNIVRKPIESLRINVVGTENVLGICKESRIPVLLTSSSEVYGKNSSDRLCENSDRILGSPAISRWSYSEAKAIDEFLALAYFKEYGLSTRVVRLFNTVGPGQLGSYGMVVPRFVSAALKNENIEIYGTGEQTRCFTHVHDVVAAIERVAFLPNTIGEIINIGNSYEISIKDLAERVIRLTNSKSDIIFKEYSEVYDDNFEDMQRRVPDISKIKRLTGWEPTRDLDSILLDVIAYEKNGR